MNLPIAERELRVAARSPRTYRARLIACAIFGVITGWMYWFSTRVAPMSTISAQTYAFTGHLALLMCMFSAVTTADALSSEKRNGTLGLLFLTDLRGTDIVFGKLAALGVVSFYALVAAIPILALPLLTGGVSGQSVFRTSINLLNALFLALSIGLWISTRSWDQKRAINLAVWMTICLVWILPFGAALLRTRPGWAEVADWLYIFSPMYQQDHASPFGVGMVREKYWTSFAITHGMAWLALWRACSLLPRAWQDRAMVPPTGRWKKFWQELRFGSPEVRRALRDQLLRINAIHWLSAREKFAPTNVWLFVVAVLIGWFGIWAWIRSITPTGPPIVLLGIPATMILYLGLRVRACGLAGEVIARDRLNGSLELLLSTTLTERDVANGQILTMFRTLLGPAIAAVFIATCLFFGILPKIENANPNAEAQAVIVYLGLIVLFACDLVASFWTGMWTACFARNIHAAAGQAVLRLLVLPWFIFITAMITCSLLGIPGGPRVEVIDAFIGWWILCMLNNVIWIRHSRARFFERLRIAAAERYQPQKTRVSWWRYFLLGERAQQISLSKAA
jgi:ABC-type transport system involved in multi-copper enzyme maturation permease subunit